MDMNCVDYFASQHQSTPSTKACPDRNKKARLILLGCQLLAAKMGMRGHQTPLRVTLDALSSVYYEEGASASLGGSKKMAARDLESIKQVFGLSGTESTGYQLGMDFPTPKAYLQMFQYWLQWLQSQHHSPDTVLMVMLEGLIAAIENAFTDDPICIPTLARALQQKYGKTNARDTRRPLRQLFDDRVMAQYLPLEMVSEEDDSYKVAVQAEPLLLRKYSRNIVHDNIDDTVVLARPGLIRSQAHVMIKQEPGDQAWKLLLILESVEKMSMWQSEDGRMAIPYTLHFQQVSHTYILVIYHPDSGSYEDIPITRIGKLPAVDETGHYCPAGINEEIWRQWKSLSYWQL